MIFKKATKSTKTTTKTPKSGCRRRPFVSALLAPVLALGSLGPFGPFASSAFACSAFQTELPASGKRSSDTYVVAKNFDWSNGRGVLVANERGRVRSRFQGDGADWKAKLGSVTLTVVGPGLPVSGMNEAGLVWEALVDFTADMGGAKRRAESLVSLEWGQYILDSFSTVEQVLSSLEIQRVTQLGLPLHFFVCEADGGCLVVEPGRKPVKVGTARKPAVLANRGWRVDLEEARDLLGSKVGRWLTSRDESAYRFATILGALESDDAPVTLRGAFDLLDEARIESLNRWQIVWDQTRRKVHLRQRDDDGGVASELAVALEPQLWTTCKATPRVATLDPDVSSLKFRDYEAEDLVRIVERLTPQLPGAGGALLAKRAAAHTTTSRCH
jgi:hypothetical protein